MRGQQPKSSLKPRARRAEVLRLGRRMETLNYHRQGLEDALLEWNQEGGMPNKYEWEQSFRSPKDTNKVLLVTANFSVLVNTSVEMFRTGARLAGLLPGRRPSSKEVVKVFYQEEILSITQKETLDTVVTLEGKLEHLSPDVQAKDIWNAVDKLRIELPEIIENLLEWLKTQSIDI